MNTSTAAIEAMPEVGAVSVINGVVKVYDPSTVKLSPESIRDDARAFSRELGDYSARNPLGLTGMA